MAAHRYWRMLGFEPYGGATVELSEVHLLDGLARVDLGAVLTSNIALTIGSVGDLQDGDTDTNASWSTAAPVVFHWDFGTDQEVSNIELGAGINRVAFPLRLVLEWSDDDTTWTMHRRLGGISWPGVRQMTSSRDGGVWSSRVRGVATSIDASRRVLTMTSATSGGRGNFGFETGRHYFEALCDSVTIVGIAAPSVSMNGLQLGSNPPNGVFGWFAGTGGKVSFPGMISGSYGAPFGPSDVIGVLLDLDAGELTFYRNGVSQGVAFSGLSGTFYPFCGNRSIGAAQSVEFPSTIQYPIADAEPWVLGTAYLITTNIVEGIAAAPAPVLIVPSDGAATPYSGTKLLRRERSRTNFLTGGTGRVIGTVKETGTPNVPVRRRVRLIRERDGMLVQEQWSDALTGAYDFQYVETNFTYTVLSYDHTGTFRAVVADKLVPEAMP